MTKFKHELEYRGESVMDSFHEKIVICGCGAIGSNLADNLVRTGFTNIKLVDFDRVEEHNLSTQIYTSDSIGQKKSRRWPSMFFLLRILKLKSIIKS